MLILMAMAILDELRFEKSFRMLEAAEVKLELATRLIFMLTGDTEKAQYSLRPGTISGMQPIRTTSPFIFVA